MVHTSPHGSTALTIETNGVSPGCFMADWRFCCCSRLQDGSRFVFYSSPGNRDREGDYISQKMSDIVCLAIVLCNNVFVLLMCRVLSSN